MPVTATTGDVYKVKVVGRIEGQITNNIFYFSSATGDSDVELHLILVLAQCFVTQLLPVLSNQFALQELRWQKVYPTLGNEQVTIPPGTLTGGQGGFDALPSFVSVVSSVRTALGGRTHRGRFYLAGFPEASADQSILKNTGGIWDGYVAFLACIVSHFVLGDPPPANGWQMQVFSRKVGGAHFPPSTATAFTPVTNINPTTLLGTTRSRRIGHGG